MSKISIEDVKPRLTELLEQITESRGKDKYVCPLCDSGNGKNHTAAFHVFRADKSKWQCFSCNEGGDILDLVGKLYDIDDVSEQLRKTIQMLGMEDNSNVGFIKKTHELPKGDNDKDTPKATQTQVETLKDYTAYYEQCQRDFAETNYLVKRGIDDQTAKEYGIGYDPLYRDPRTGNTWQAIIFPLSRSAYAVRNTDPEADKDNRHRKAGKQTYFNLKALETATKPIFIVEGIIDALSIIEAGGEAIALGGVSHNNLVKILQETPPKQLLIIALDNDPTGQTNSDKLHKELRDLKIPHVVYNPYGECKDANEALLDDLNHFDYQFRDAVAKAKDLKDLEMEADKQEYLRTSAKHLIQSFIDGISDSVNTPPIKTGYGLLDQVLEGGLYEGLYVLGAISSLGKTTYALQMMDQIAQRGHDVLIFSLEMSKFELMAKSISRQTFMKCVEDNIDWRFAKSNRNITNGLKWKEYGEYQKTHIYESVSEYERFSDKIYMHEGIGEIGVDYIRKRISQHITYTGNKPVVLIDYLQILAPKDTRATDKQNTDYAVTELKRISRDFKIPVLAISSFNRANYNQSVGMEAFKESGAIEYSSDVLLGLQFKRISQDGFDVNDEKRGRGEYKQRAVELVVLKNRNGQTGDHIELEYYPIFNHFNELKIANKG